MKAKSAAFGVPTCRYCGADLEFEEHGMCDACGRKAASYRHGCYIVVGVPEGESRNWLGGHFRKTPKSPDNSGGLPEGIRAEYWFQDDFEGLYEVVSVWKKITPKGYKPRGDGVFLGEKAKK